MRRRVGDGTGVSRSPQQRADARQQFSGGEGLDEVVVGAFLEAADAIALFGARRQHDDRHRGPAAHLPEYFKAVDDRQHDVENDQIPFRLQCRTQTRSSVVDRRDTKAMMTEKLGHHLAELDIVVHQEDCRLFAMRSTSAAVTGPWRPAA